METVIDPHKVSFTVDDTSVNYKHIIKRVCEHSKKSLTQYTTMPNHTCYFMEPPSGSVMVFKSNTPFNMDVFCTDMFKGTTIKEIDALDEQLLKRKDMLQNHYNNQM